MQRRQHAPAAARPAAPAPAAAAATSRALSCRPQQRNARMLCRAAGGQPAPEAVATALSALQAQQRVDAAAVAMRQLQRQQLAQQQQQQQQLGQQQQQQLVMQQQQGQQQQQQQRQLYQLADAGAPAAAPGAAAGLLPASSSLMPWALAGAAALAAVLAAKRVYDTPSRSYDGNVGDEYDAWTDEGILEHYWGEHIHLGYYTDDELNRGWWTADFKAAKLRFTREMHRFSGAAKPKRILDVGCGFGGSSRWLAAQFPEAEVVGITLSPKQVARGTQLAAERGLSNVKFMVMDALAMQFPDGQFDLVWACESGEHMPDKRRYVEEMARVLAPGGSLVVACWCQREAGVNGAPPLSPKEQADLDFLYAEWAHPFFISIAEFGRLMKGTGVLEAVREEDWTRETIASWRHSNLVGVLDPWFVVFKWNPKLWYKVTREIVTLERMHRAFAKGLMQYGLIAARKKQQQPQGQEQGEGDKEVVGAAQA